MDTPVEDGTVRSPNEGSTSTVVAPQNGLTPQLILSELVATISERWSVWDSAREEARVALRG